MLPVVSLAFYTWLTVSSRDQKFHHKYHLIKTLARIFHELSVFLICSLYIYRIPDLSTSFDKFKQASIVQVKSDHDTV